MKDIMGMMKQLGQLQSRMQTMQEELARAEIGGQSGGGLVTVTLDGKAGLKRINIDPSLLKPEEVINGLHPRVAITFTPGVPPIWTWLTRYYEKGFGAPTGLSPAKMILDSACLFLCSAMLAALFTAGLFQHSFR